MSMGGHNSFIWVNGAAMPTPKSAEWNLQDVSKGESGRTEDGTMHKNRVGQKRKWTFTWRPTTLEEASLIIRAFNPEYINVTTWDFLDGGYSTRTYYVGDRRIPVKLWWDNQKLTESISFDIIEQ